MSEVCRYCGRKFTSVMAKAHIARHEPACARSINDGQSALGLEVGTRYRLTVQVGGKRGQVIGVVMSNTFPGQWPLYIKRDDGRNRFYSFVEVLEREEVNDGTGS